jgi:hypothetical protein
VLENVGAVIMPIDGLGKILMALGAMLFVLGAVLVFGARFGLGQLPGDISVQRGNWSLHAPIVTGIVLSIVGTIVLNILLRFFR